MTLAIRAIRGESMSLRLKTIWFMRLAWPYSACCVGPTPIE